MPRDLHGVKKGDRIFVAYLGHRRGDRKPGEYMDVIAAGPKFVTVGVYGGRMPVRFQRDDARQDSGSFTGAPTWAAYRSADEERAELARAELEATGRRLISDVSRCGLSRLSDAGLLLFVATLKQVAGEPTNGNSTA